MELPEDTQIRWTVSRMAKLVDLGAEPVRGLVLPDGNYFPDRFDGTPAAIDALLKRVLEHAGLAHLKVDLGVVTQEGQTVSCSSGACGGGANVGAGNIDTRITRVSRGDHEGSYSVRLTAGEVGHPIVLTTTLVRAVATMFLFEVDGYRDFDPREAEPITDLAAVLLGFGVLVTNGAYLYLKGCGGAKVHAATKMPLAQLAVALAIFCAMNDVEARVARRNLEVTQKEAFDEAMVWARSNGSLVRMLRDNRAAIAADAYRLAPARSWLSRALGFGKKRAPDPDDLDDLERAMQDGAASSKRLPASQKMDAAKRKRLEELRALVDESMTE